MTEPAKLSYAELEQQFILSQNDLKNLRLSVSEVLRYLDDIRCLYCGRGGGLNHGHNTECPLGHLRTTLVLQATEPFKDRPIKG